jgi:hypothetical protein
MKMLLPLAVIMLIGVGCTESSQTQTLAPVPPPAPLTTSTSEANNPPAADATLPAIDDTWRTHTSRAGDFSFQWPTKGRYAPTWEVAIEATDPCMGNGSFSTKDGITFCHSSGIVNPVTGGDYPHTGTTSFSDTYSTPYNGKFLVITFKKDGAYDIDETTYQAHLDQIMGTFVMKED